MEEEITKPDLLVENEIKTLREQNTSLVKQVQFLKIQVAEINNSKLDLLKENSDLRLKLSRLRTSTASQALALDRALQSASEEALTHLVQASTAVTRTIELAKSYVREKQEVENFSPNWSNLSTTPVKDKIHKVAPLMRDGKCIQPFVPLYRIPLNSSHSSAPGSPNQNRNVTERVLPLPMHLLQDVYIPLQRIDLQEFNANVSEEHDQIEEEEHAMTEDIAEEQTEQPRLSERQDFETTPRHELHVVHEETEPIESRSTSRNDSYNPLEGPSWLLDVPRRRKRSRRPLEPDSTTDPDESYVPSPVLPCSRHHSNKKQNDSSKENISNQEERTAFTPTMRRRKRTSPAPEAVPDTPPPLDDPHEQSHQSPPQLTGRVLKVIVPKMSLPASPLTRDSTLNESTPPKREMTFDAPSPNGATDGRLVVMDHSTRSHTVAKRERTSSTRSTSGDSDCLDHALRTRRSRKPIAYKEVPLNRKMRRT